MKKERKIAYIYIYMSERERERTYRDSKTRHIVRGGKVEENE